MRKPEFGPVRAILLSFLLVVGAGLFCIGAPAHGQGFDCRYARSPDEQLICRDPRLSRLDEELNSVYARQYYSQPGSGRTRLDQAEDAWVIERRRCGADSACIEQSYRRRIEQLGVTTARPEHSAVAQPQQGTAPRPQPNAVARPEPGAVARPDQQVLPHQGTAARPEPGTVARPQQPVVAQPQQPAVAQPQQPAVAQPQQPAVAQPG